MYAFILEYLALIFCIYKLGYQAEQALWKQDCIRELQSSLQRGRDKNLFFRYGNQGQLLILLVTFKAIGSPQRVSSNERPRYVTV